MSEYVEQHNEWVDEVGKYIESEEPKDIILFCVSYTLQSLRAEEDMLRFRW